MRPRASIRLATYQASSASAKPAVIHVLSNLLGEEQFAALDCFLAGDDVENKKPHPEIYNLAAERLGLAKEECVVIEDSGIGCKAAKAAEMACLVTTSTYTLDEDFSGADRIVPELGEPGREVCVTLADLRALLQ